MKDDRIRIPAGMVSTQGTIVSCASMALFPLVWSLSAAGIKRLENMPEWVIWAGMWIAYLLPIALVIAQIVSSVAFAVYLGSEDVVITCLGVPYRRHALSELKMICGVDNYWEQSLCLSCYSVEELATLREKKLKKGFLTKDEVHLRKRSGNWQEKFAREHLNALRRKMFLWTEKSVVWLKFDPMTVMLLRNLYPQLSYYNFLEKFGDRMLPQRPDMVPAMALQVRERICEIRSDGIHVLYKNGEEDWMLQSEAIQTIARIDLFPFSRYDLRHVVYLVVSALTVEEMTATQCANDSRGWKTLAAAHFPDGHTALALEYCIRRVWRWGKKDTDICPMYYTPEKEQQLRQLCPHARWVDLSRYWIEDGEG